MVAENKTIGTDTHAAQTGTLQAAILGATAIVGNGTNFDPEFVAGTDRLIINHANPDAGWHSYAISAVADDTHMTIVGGLVEALAGGEIPYKQGGVRDYSTITLWEADDGGGDGVLGNDDCTGSCYDDSAFDEAVLVNFQAKTTVLTVAVGERHNGTAGTGARIVRSGIGASEHTIGLSGGDTGLPQSLMWLEIDQGRHSTARPMALDVNLAGDGSQISHLLLHGVLASAEAWGINCNAYDVDFHNLIVYDIEASVGVAGDRAYGIYQALNKAFEWYNITIHDINASNKGDAYGIKADEGGGVKLQNILATDVVANDGTGKCYSTTNPTTEDYNLATDDTDAGANSLGADDGVITANQFVSTSPVNLHLKAGADAINEGVDLGQTPSGVEFDIDNFDRHTAGVVWDMGADEYVAAVVGQPMMRRWGGVPHMPWGAPTPSGRSW